MIETEINFDKTDHTCDVHFDGDWVIFRCPVCQGYERRINMVTGEMNTVGVSEIFSHSGMTFSWNQVLQ